MLNRDCVGVMASVMKAKERTWVIPFFYLLSQQITNPVLQSQWREHVYQYLRRSSRRYRTGLRNELASRNARNQKNPCSNLLFLFHQFIVANFFHSYYQRPEVVHALHATAHPGSWVECRSSVHHAFHEKDIESSISVLPRVLSKIPALLFVGDQDLICNYIGIENMIKGLNWNGQTGLGVC